MSANAPQVQYTYANAGYPAGSQAGIPMEPVAGQPMYGGAPPTVSYQTIGASSVLQSQPMAASSIIQAGSQVTYGAPQAMTGQSVYVQPSAQESQTVTYMQQEGHQYATAAPVYVQAAQPQMQAMQQQAQEYINPGVTYTTPATIAQPVGWPSGSFAGAQPARGATYQTMPTQATYYFPTTVQEAWNNHFEAFSNKNVEQIMRDYDETSVVRVYSTDTNQLETYSGTMQIRGFFDATFRGLTDTSSLDAPVAKVEEDMKQVYLIWKCPSSGVNLASDTFIFGPDNKIKRQNVTLYKQQGFVPRPGAAGAAASMGAAAAMGAAAGAASPGGATRPQPGSQVSSAKASKKKDSKKKLGSKKKAKGGFC